MAFAPAALSAVKNFPQLPGQSGRPTGMPQPAQSPRVNQPAAPAMSLKPVGRPPGQPGTNGYKQRLAGAGGGFMGGSAVAASLGSAAANLAGQVNKSAAGSPAGASAMTQKALGTGANRNPDLVKAATGFIKAGADLAPAQRKALEAVNAGTDTAPAGTVSLPPGVTPQAPAPEPGPRRAQPRPAAERGAAVGVAPGAGDQPLAAAGTPQMGASQAAPAVATPETAHSQRLKASPWEYEKKWGAMSSLGDADIDSTVKQQIIDQMNNSPFDESARARESGRIFEEGMAGQSAETNRLKADLARRGITGPDAARIIAESNTANRANISQAQRTSLLDMTREEATHKLNATAQGQQVGAELAKRGVDIETLRMNREQLAQQLKAAKQRGGGGGGGEQMLEIMNPDGSMSQVPMNMVGLALDLMEGGYE